jgi:hypothetical protein
MLDQGLLTLWKYRRYFFSLNTPSQKKKEKIISLENLNKKQTKKLCLPHCSLVKPSLQGRLGLSIIVVLISLIKIVTETIPSSFFDLILTGVRASRC